jgi:CRP-like cAMP-binding protein
MDEQLVLTAQTLRLNPNVQRTNMPGGVSVLKNVPARRYLTVTLDQWNLLRNFSTPATVPDVLRAVILNRSCVPLREYYELILKAQKVGVLRLERQTEPDERARRWAVPLNAWIAIILGWIAIAAAVVLLMTQPFTYPPSWPAGAMDVFIGWILLCLGLSAGSALAASVLVWGGGEIYDPKFHLFRPTPYFWVNLDDACMTSRLTQIGVWSAKLMPVMLTAGLLWWYQPAWGTLHALAVLVMLRPVGGGSVTPILSVLFRGQILDTHKEMAFSPNRRWKVRLRFGIARVCALYVAARLIWGAAWCFLLLYVALKTFDRSVREVLGSGEYWREVGLGFGAVALVAFLIFVGRPISRSLWVRSRARYREIAQMMRRWRAKPGEFNNPDVVARLLADSLIFRRLSPAERVELLKCARPQVFKAWSLMRKFSDKSTDVGIILSGGVAVYRRLKSGRAERVLELGEGDVFGAHALLDTGRPEAQVRALTPVIALILPVEEFQQRVVATLGVPLANDLVHKVPFLRRLSFCHSWHPQAVARFAQISSVVGYNENETIVAERQDNHQFYVVYEGRVQVRRGKKLLSRLEPGGFFGEIALLQNSSAIADVMTRENVRCLTFSKADFLRFMTHNPLVGLQLEEISSRRLGYPIFPLNAHSFDVR